MRWAAVVLALALALWIPFRVAGEGFPTLEQARAELLRSNPEIRAARVALENLAPGRWERLGDAVSARLVGSWRLTERDRSSLAPGTEVYVAGDGVYTDSTYAGFTVALDLGKLSGAALGRPSAKKRREIARRQAELEVLIANKLGELELRYVERRELTAKRDAAAASLEAARVGLRGLYEHAMGSEMETVDRAALVRGEEEKILAALLPKLGEVSVAQERESWAKALAGVEEKRSGLRSAELRILHLLGRSGADRRDTTKRPALWAGAQHEGGGGP